MKRFLLSASALALTLTGLSGAPLARDWSKIEFSAGAIVGFGPDYEGSDDYEAVALPMIDLNWADTVLIDMDGLKVNALAVESGKSSFTAGPLIGYDMGRNEDDNDALRGLGDIDGSVEGGGFIAYEYGPWMADMVVKTDLGDGHGGTVAELSAGYGWRFQEGKISLATGLATSWASDDYMQSYFGIDTVQASNSAYSRHDAGAGFKDVGLWFKANYDFAEDWSVFALSRTSRLLGDAADSPIVEDEGSATQFSTGIGISYKF